MGQPVTLHSQYAGMAQDFSRDQLPAPFVWNLQDFFPNALGAPLRKRGGWVNASSAIGSTSAIARVAYGQTQHGIELIAIDSATSTSAGNTVWTIATATGVATSAGSVTAASAGSALGSVTLGDPVFYSNKLIIPLGYADSLSGTDPGTYGLPTVFDGLNFNKVTSATTGGGTVSGSRFAAVYKDRVVLGGTANHNRRLNFSAAGDPEDYSDRTSWIDTAATITGLAALPNALIVFSADRAQRIRGSTPPPGSDMVLDRLSDFGCIDYRSIITWNGKAIYADTNGVYMTDGINTADLTEAGFIQLYYQALLATYNTSWKLRGGQFRDYYYLSIVDDSNVFVDCLVCDLRKRAWFRFQNFNFRHFVEAKGSHQEFYAACGDQNKVARLTDIFTPAAANKNDGDGDAVLPIVEYPIQRGYRLLRRKWITSQGLTRHKRLYLSYDLRDAATDNPVLTMSYVTTPGATSYTAMTPTLAETTDYTRVGRSYGPSGARGGKIVSGLGVKVAQTNASSDTRIYTLQAEYEALEESRIAQ